MKHTPDAVQSTQPVTPVDPQPDEEQECESEGPWEWEYTPSCTAGDYGPGNPWDAPGMSIHDFI